MIKVRKKGGTLSPDLRGSTDKWSFGGKRKIKVKELSVVGLTHKSFITPKSFHFLPTLINNLLKIFLVFSSRRLFPEIRFLSKKMRYFYF